MFMYPADDVKVVTDRRRLRGQPVGGEDDQIVRGGAVALAVGRVHGEDVLEPGTRFVCRYWLMGPIGVIGTEKAE